MKLSRYNILRTIEGRNIFFNAKTCALAEVNEDFLSIVHDVTENDYDETQYDAQLVRDMKASGCLVADDVFELKEIEFHRNLAKYDTTHLGLTIAPTLDCNFRCKYCFEHHPKGTMSEEVQSNLLNFVAERIRAAKNLSITWYGGEPLLAKEIIYDLSEQFVKLCQQENVAYDAFIITNASLLDDTDILRFKEYKIKGAQITIDGPPKVHDKRRRNITKESTFDYLINRVNVLLDNDFDVIVRINVDKENISEVEQLLSILREHIKRYQYLKIDFGQVTAFTDVCRSVENDCYNNKQYADIILPLYTLVEKQGFSINKMAVYPSPRLNYCCVDYVNSFVVDVNGDLFRCWNHVGNREKSCGNVKDFNIRNLNDNYLSWIMNDPLHNEKCHTCQLLPICMGGCADAMRNSVDKQPVCGTIKYNLDKVIEYYCQQLHEGGELG